MTQHDPTSDCAPFRELLSPRIDGELTGDEAARLEAHLTGCGACRDQLTALERLSADVAADLRALHEEAPPRPMGLPPASTEGGPDHEPVAPSPGVEPRPIPRGLRIAASVLFLLFVGAWLFDGTDDGLRTRAADLATDLARPGTRFLVHARPPEQAGEQPERPEDELVHLLQIGPGGAYVWQLVPDGTTAFQADTYLLGSDGAELWTWDPATATGRTLAVSAVPDPLPRAMSLLFDQLEAGARASLGEVRGRGPWREVEIAAGPAPEDARVRFLFTEDDELLGLEVLPRLDLAVFVEPLLGDGPPQLPSGLDPFALSTRTLGVDAPALLALEPPAQPQPDVLWQLGYTPGAPPATWPEQLSALARELGALGYL